MFRKMAVFVALGLASSFGTAMAGGATVLTESSFEKEVFDSGKNSIIKFYAPWCGHCKAMAPAWAELGTAYEGSSSVLIGDVDCTVHASTCSKFDVSGYPTIKYFKDGDKKGESFNSGRDLESLKSWVADNLEIKCQVADTKGCSDKEIKFIDTMKAKSGEDRKKELARLDGMKTGSMKPELKQWLVARQNILKQLE